MFKKFEGVRDEELVFIYKKNKDDDVEMELVNRYKIHSKKLAGEQYQKFKYVFQIEYEDIYAICLSTLFTAIKSFKRCESFFRLWKTISTNEINIYVTTLPLLRFESNISYVSTSRDMNDILTIASPKVEDHNIDLSSDIERILKKNKDQFDPKDRDILILYVAGYSVSDIAKETGLKYYYVRTRVGIIKDAIEKYFVQSIE